MSKQALIISAILHGTLLLLLLVGLPSVWKPLPPQQLVVVPVEVTEIGELTNTRVREEKPPEPKPPTPEAKEPPKPAPPPPAAKPPEPTPPKPEPPKPEAKPVDPLAEVLKKVEKKEKPKEEEKPADQLTSVLKNVAKLKPTEKPDDARAKPTQNAAPASSNAPSLADRLTISEEDALRRQISSCWNMPIGARNAEQLIVQVVIDVNPDRTVAKAEVVNSEQMRDPFFRAAAESALRALRHPRCNPLALPEGKADSWKRIYFNFDPRDML